MFKRIAVIAMLALAFTVKARSQQMVYLWPESLKGQWINVRVIIVDANQILAGTWNNFIFRSTDRGHSWSQLKSGLASGTINAFSISQNGLIYAADDMGGIFTSLDSGITWKALALPNGFFAAYSILSSQNSLLAGVTGVNATVPSVAKSTDGGRTWRYVVPHNANAYPLHLLDTKAGAILLAEGYAPYSSNDSTGGGILRSTDDGETWSWSNTGLYVQNVWSLAVDTASGKVFAGTRYGDIYSSTDDGLTWQKMQGPSWAGQTSGVNSLLAYRGKLFAGFSNPLPGTIGLAYTKDNGATWTDIGDDISSVPGSMCLSLAQIGDTLLIGTADGIWADTKILTAVHSPIQFIPSGFTLSQNYPNPFNPTTSILYTVSSREYTTLTVYNVLGEKVATLVDGEKAPGSYTVTFDGSKLPSGVYFYRLQAGPPTGGFTQTRRMVLVK
jgi:hypothetical protein